jgi:hypothetical protein
MGERNREDFISRVPFPLFALRLSAFAFDVMRENDYKRREFPAFQRGTKGFTGQICSGNS